MTLLTALRNSIQLNIAQVMRVPEVYIPNELLFVKFVMYRVSVWSITIIRFSKTVLGNETLQLVVQQYK